jgi:uncharacterized protein YjbJ (UPF0337 family)
METLAKESKARLRGDPMLPSTQNEATGQLHEVKGAIKEELGKLTGNPKLEDEGAVENLSGHIQKKIGQIQKVVEKP